MEQQPENFAERQSQGAAQGAKGVAEQTERVAQQPGLSPGMSEALQRAMGAAARKQVESQADKLAGAENSAARGEAAGRLRELLEKMAEAGQQAEQGQAQQAGSNSLGGDALRESGHSALARGMRELETLARQEKQPRLTQQQQRELRQDAAAQFAEAVPAIYGHNQRSQEFVEQLRRDLTEKMTPVDLETVRQLASQLDALRRETNVTARDTQAPAEIRQIDASRVPPAYRRAVEKYFETLSEKP